MESGSHVVSKESFQLYYLMNQADEENETNWELPENRELEGHSFQTSYPHEFNTPSTKTSMLQILDKTSNILGNRNKQFYLSVVIGNCSPPPDFN
jgi:hypothetical protein